MMISLICHVYNYFHTIMTSLIISQWSCLYFYTIMTIMTSLIVMFICLYNGDFIAIISVILYIILVLLLWSCLYFYTIIWSCLYFYTIMTIMTALIVMFICL